MKSGSRIKLHTSRCNPDGASRVAAALRRGHWKPHQLHRTATDLVARNVGVPRSWVMLTNSCTTALATAYRFLGALGLGGTWPLCVALVVETWPEKNRAVLAGAIGSAANVGYLFAAIYSKQMLAHGANWRWISITKKSGPQSPKSATASRTDWALHSIPSCCRAKYAPEKSRTSAPRPMSWLRTSGFMTG